MSQIPYVIHLLLQRDGCRTVVRNQSLKPESSQMATEKKPQPQQGGAQTPAQQQGQQDSTPQQQGSQPIFRDWAAI